LKHDRNIAASEAKRISLPQALCGVISKWPHGGIIVGRRLEGYRRWAPLEAVCDTRRRPALQCPIDMLMLRG